MTPYRALLVLLVAAFGLLATVGSHADEPLTDLRIELNPKMMTNEADAGDMSGLVDEQREITGPPAGAPSVKWELNSMHFKDQFPWHSYIDLGEEKNLSNFYFYDTNGVGRFDVSVGKPGDWQVLHELKTDRYKAWHEVPMDVTTRYVRITIHDGAANFTEIALHEYTDQAHEAMLAQKAAEAKAQAEREAALAAAREEMKKRPLVDVGEPFGKLYLVDEIDVTDPNTHMFEEYPKGNSRIQTINGQKVRVVPKVEGEAAYIAYRIGQMKLLQPGMRYVLQIEYPQDEPRTMVVHNYGSESIRGFHTGATLGDALRAKYVGSNPESLQFPLTGEFENWTSMFNLHDRTPELGVRGSGKRNLTAEDGFMVAISQFSAENMPVSEGIAVSKIRLFAVPEPEKFNLALNVPDDLPKRRIFWREEMADGVIQSEKVEERGVTDYIQWWAYKRNLMQFLGINTYSKDLLEFGANQHWDPTEYDGNKWVYFNHYHRNDWANIVTMMGEAGFDVLPYYEYTGSKGSDGLGNKKRARPLTRDDAYTHIKWVQSHNVDLTDPDAYEDFKKMLDLTVIRHQDKADFVGAWLRNRGGMPISFAEATLERFANQANDGNKITRQNLIDDKALLDRYYEWWFIKRQEFFTAMRDHLRDNGVDDAKILYTANPSEKGIGLEGGLVVTDDPTRWNAIAQTEPHASNNTKIQPISLAQVRQDDLYLKQLLDWPGTWGSWEWHHNAPPADPRHYKDVEGVLLTHDFNTQFTVADPDSLEAFTTPTGLALVRHYHLNENMLFDKNDKPLLGYFVADIERAGPYCMAAEAAAMANGNPTMLGYLTGHSYQRGFPEYVRNFNQAFLALPALPSRLLDNAASNDSVVVRTIDAGQHGTYLAIVNNGMADASNVKIKLPKAGKVTDAATGEAINAADTTLELSFYPYQLRAIRIQ